MWYIFPSILFSSVQKGLTAMMYAILEREKNESPDDEEEEYIPIESREKIVQLLIDGRADVNAQNQVLGKHC